MNPMIPDTIAIAIGAIAGAITRYQTGKVVTEYISHHVHPNDVTKQSYYLGWHTAFINITGSFLLGAIVATPSISTVIVTALPATNLESSKSTIPTQTITSTTTQTSMHTIPGVRPTVSPASMAKSTAVSSSYTFGLTPRLKLLLGVGFCGSYTTFSTFSVDVVSWIMQGQTSKALSYLAINNIGGITAAAIGMTFMKKLVETASK